MKLFEERLDESIAAANRTSAIYERNLEVADLDSFLLEDSTPLLKTAVDRLGISPVLRAVADVCWNKGEIKTDPNHEHWTSVAAKLDNLADDIMEIIPHPEYEPEPPPAPTTEPAPVESGEEW